MGSDSRTATATSSKPRPSWRNRHLNQLSDEQLNEVKKHRGSDSSIAEVVGVEAASAAEQARQDEVNESKLPRRQAGPERRDSREPSQNRQRSQSRAPERDDVRNRDDRYARQSERPRGNRVDARAGISRDTESNQRRYDRDDARHQSGHLPSQPERQQEDRHLNRRAGGEVHSDYQRDNRGQQRSYDDYADHGRRHNSAPQHGTGQRSRREPARRDDGYRRSGKVGDAHRSAPDRSAQAGSAHAGSERDRPVTDASPAAAEVASKKSFVTTLLDFSLPKPVKYSLMALAVVLMVAVSIMKPIDNSSQSQLDSALTRAMIGFGLARTLNGVISVAQGTEFAVQPAGVGVNFSPGEILDPINDLVERFSWVMLLATSSLGVQKILLEVSSWAGISVLLAGAGLFFLLTRMRNSSVARMADIAGKLLLVMLLVRFLIPVGSLANDWVYKQFLQPRYEQSSAQLEIASNRIREISTRQTQPEQSDGSLKDRAKKFYSSMTSKFDFDGMLDDYKNSAENVSEHAINLIVVFMLQTIVFPLLFLYLIYRLFRTVLLPSRLTRH